MDLDYRKLMSGALYGSSVVDNAINQVFGTSPIKMKLNEIEFLLQKDFNILNFKYYFNVKNLAFDCNIRYEGNDHYFTITEDTLRNAPVKFLVKEIAEYVETSPIATDPEYMFENENEQAMLDAARDYGFV